MSGEGMQYLARSQVPHLNGVVVTATGEEAAVRANGNGTHVVGMSGEGTAQFSILPGMGSAQGGD
jgi:hypothetical protein